MLEFGLSVCREINENFYLLVLQCMEALKCTEEYWHLGFGIGLWIILWGIIHFHIIGHKVIQETITILSERNP